MSVTLRCARDRLRFPAQCLQCRGAATGCYFVDGVEVPLCVACTSKFTITRALWVAFGTALGVTFVISVGAFLDAWMRFPQASGMRSMVGFVIALGLLGAGMGAMYYVARFGWRRHAERSLPVREGVPSEALGMVSLVFRDAEMAHEVAVLSGLTAPAIDYRSASSTAGYAPRGSALFGLVPLSLMAIFIAAGWSWFSDDADVPHILRDPFFASVFAIAGLVFGGYFVVWCWQRFARTKNTD